jgi:hypothetical protein
MYTKLPAAGTTLLFAVCATLALTGVERLNAQATDGNLVGRVVDQMGASIPSAAVEITNTATNVKSTTTTDTQGVYRFNNILVGSYDLKVSRAGFSTANLHNIGVTLNRTATANVTLAVGDIATVVDVTETPALIDTTTAQVSSTFETREAIDTPSSSLPEGVLNLSLLGAGVANAGGVGLGDGPSVGGQRPRNNSFNIEGVDNNRSDVTGINYHVPNEAVSEFSMLLNQYSAEFGNGTGGQFNTVIKGGTNQIHGALFEYLQNRNLNAIDQAVARNGLKENPRYDQNTFGGAIGGPIIKDKLFYYGLYQYNPTGQVGTPSSAILAPTAAGYSQLSSIPGLSQTNLNVLKQYLPAAPSASTTTTVSGVAIPIGILPVTQPSYTNITTYLISIDYNVSSKDQIRGRFGNEKHTGFDTSTLPALPAFFQGRDDTSKFLSFSELHTFSPTLFNEFRFGYNRFNDNIPAGNYQYPGLDVFPNITIENDLNLQLGPYDNAPQSTILNTYQLVDNVSWTKGTHSFKFGWEGRDYINLTHFIQRERGDYGYKTLERFLLDQNPNVIAERNVGGLPYSGNRPAISLFGNDDWKLKPNLTVNIGLRWEWKGVPRDDSLQALNAISSVPGLIDFRAPTSQLTAFGPRIGIAYSPGTSGTTSIRAGFGISYDKYFDNLSTLSLPPQITSTVDIPLATTTSNFLKNGGILPTAHGAAACTTVQECRDATSAYIYDQNLPYAVAWNFGIQHVFHNDYTVEARYLGTHGVHLFTQSRINNGAVVTPTQYLPTYLQMPSTATLAALPTTLGDLFNVDAILPAWQPYFDNTLITAFPNRGNSIYHGLALQVTRRYARNLLFTGAYTWSHNIDDSTADLYSTLLAPRRPQDFQNLTSERSNSFLDRRHRLTFNWVYDTPWYKSASNKLLRYVLGGYTLSGTYTYESPQLATVQSGLDSNLNYDSAGDRAIVNVNGTPNTGSGVNAIDANGNVVDLGSDSTVAYVAQNPNAQYIVAGYGALANSGRQTIATRPINNWDLQVKKSFNFTERYTFQLAVQLLNAFNHPQYVPGYINIVQFHESRDTRNNLIPGNALFNRPDQVYNSNARFLQLTARFEF